MFAYVRHYNIVHHKPTFWRTKHLFKGLFSWNSCFKYEYYITVVWFIFKSRLLRLALSKTNILYYEHKNWSNTKSSDNLPRTWKWIGWIVSTKTTFSAIFVSSAISSFPTRLRFRDCFAFAFSVTNLKSKYWKYRLGICIDIMYVRHYNLWLVCYKLTLRRSKTFKGLFS